MQMTESYAATVAAVVPVLWLVGALEQHQVARSFAQRLREIEELTAEHHRALVSLREGVSVAEVATALEGLKGLKPDRDAKLKNFASAAWALTVGALLVAETQALGWLADSSRGPDEFWAEYCLWATVLGFAAVGVIPLVIAAVTGSRADKGTREALRELQEHRGRLTADFNARLQVLKDRLHEARTPEDLEEVERLMRELYGDDDGGVQE
ncbi:hypothetical protein [Streptomyces sp. NPDC093600]|uniref:hypothetical protein n=1 Tax=Streptomyces sp. NPDC093600 TaxID=3366047 RepID=UPI003810DB00